MRAYIKLSDGQETEVEVRQGPNTKYVILVGDPDILEAASKSVEASLDQGDGREAMKIQVELIRGEFRAVSTV